MAKPGPTHRAVMYRPIERHWYRLADFAQGIWHRFAPSRTGRFTIWFVSRFLWLTLRTLMYVLAASAV